MKITVNSKILQKALENVSKALKPNNTMPILDNIKFEFNTSVLTLTCTNLDITIIEDVNINSDYTGAFTLPGKLLLDLCKKLSDIDIVIEEKATLINISTDTGKYTMPFIDVHNYPNTPLVDIDSVYVFESNVLNDTIKHTIFAVASDEMRPALCGIYFDFAEGYAVATDAHKLVRIPINKADIPNFILPAKAAKVIKDLSILSQIRYSANENFGCFSFDNIKVITRLTDANYPKYNAVIPTVFGTTIKVNKNNLSNILKRTSLFTNSNVRVVKLDFKERLVIAAQDIDLAKNSNETLDIEKEGNDITIAFNVLFLTELITMVSDDTIIFKFIGNNRPCVITPENNENHLQLLMPCLIE